MGGADVRRLLLLGALWGGSFILIRVAVPVLGPVALCAARVLIAAVTLIAYARVTGSALELRARWREYLAVGVLNAAIPFTLIAAAEVRLTASLAAILNATSPLFGAFFAALWLRDPFTRQKLAGSLLAIVGVAVVVGWSPVPLDPPTFLCIGCSLLAAGFYGFAGTYTRARVHGAPPIGLATGCQLGASAALLPFVPLVPPHAVPTPVELACVLALGVLATAIAHMLYFRLVVNVGPARALTVTFLTPAFGMLWGALFLKEQITPIRGLGAAVILLGAALVTGVLPAAPRKPAPVEVPVD